jgi:glyoxylase-like metal-dependent hydrolase (beta-lactamase superfamily II)
MSMLVRSRGLPPLLFVGDLTYELEPLYNDQVPGVGDAEQLKASFEKVRELRAAMPDLVVLPSHDPLASGTLATITEPDRQQHRRAF